MGKMRIKRDRISAYNNDIISKYLQVQFVERSLLQETCDSKKCLLEGFYAFIEKDANLIVIGDIRAYMLYKHNHNEWKKKNNYIMFISVIKDFYRFLVEEEIIVKNPAAKLRSPQLIGEPQIKFADTNEISRLKGVMNSHVFTNRDRAIFYLLISTGVRVGELLRLKKNQFINLNERKMFIAKTKTCRPHFVMFSEVAAYFLKRYLLEDQLSVSEYLFHFRTGECLTIGVIHCMLRKLYSLAFPGWDRPKGPHLFRHTFATDWVRNNSDLTGLQSIMGWSSINMVDVYVHQSEEMVTRAYKTYERRKKKDRWELSIFKEPEQKKKKFDWEKKRLDKKMKKNIIKNDGGEDADNSNNSINTINNTIGAAGNPSDPALQSI